MKNLQIFLAASLTLLLGCSKDDGPAVFTVPQQINFGVVASVEVDPQFTADINLATGFVGSPLHNSLFYAYRSTDDDQAEKVVRYNLSTRQTTFSTFEQVDFVTKRLHVLEDELVVFGGSFVNTYDVDLADLQSSVVHGLSLSRFGSVLYDGDIHVFGGDLQEVDADKIKRFDRESNTFLTVGTLPAPRFWAHGEVVGSKLYIFGGQPAFSGPPQDDIFVFDLDTKSLEVFEFPDEVHRTFTAAYQHVIFVAAQQWNGNDIDLYFGVFDTETNEFTEIDTSLSEDEAETIHAMTVMGDRLFIIYGDAGGQEGFAIMSYDLLG